MASYMFSGRTEQAKAAFRRKADATILRQQRHWRGAMYLLGYAVECKLKARLMEIHRARTLGELEERLSKRIGTRVQLTGKEGHSIVRLVELTGARTRMDRETFIAYTMCAHWRVDWRYDPQEGKETECQEFFESATRFLGFVASSI